MSTDLLDPRALFELIPVPMLVVDAETLAILQVNEAAVACYGYAREEFLAMRATHLRDPEKVWRHRKKDGTEFDVEVRSVRVKAGERDAELELVYDMTPHRTLQEQLRQAQKVGAIGLFLGGVAHDFNNFLTIILGAVEMGRRAAALGRSPTEALGVVNEAAIRAAELTRKLLTISRKRATRLLTVDLNDILTDFGKLIGLVVGEDVIVDVRMEAIPQWVQVDPSQLEQVLLNLCTNARQAMPRGGKLVLEARGVGASVELSVTDTGIGMDDATLARIFEPFFTTKECGTGLGLSVVRGIVDQQRAELHVDSKPGGGTTVRVLWPRADVPKAQGSTQADAPLAGGCETLLVVEDQAALRTLMASSLSELGYEVLTAETGEGAILEIERRRNDIALAIMDFVLPDMNGDAAFARMRAVVPLLRAVFITGYAPERTNLAKLQAERDCLVIDKPFTFAELARGVRAALDAGR